MIKKRLSDEDFDDIANDIFFGEQVDLEEFQKTLEKILVNITEIRKTPMNKRDYEDWG